jgi:hypothetical protein
MFTFGKKCPRCGSMAIVPKNGTQGHMGAFALGRYLCRDCRQSISHRLFFSYTEDQRRWQRHRLPSTFVIRIHDHQDQYARIADISASGIGFFSGMGGESLAGKRVLVDLFNCDDGTSLEQLSVEILASRIDHLDANPGYRSVVLNRARFTQLNQAQVKVLNNCISRYSLAKNRGSATLP